MRSAALALALEFVIALPDHPAVLVCAVPDLGAEVVATIAADQSGGKDALSAVTPAQRFPPGKFLLHPVEQQRVDDCLMAVLYIVLRDLALVDLHLLLQEIHGEALLVAGAGVEPAWGSL